METSKLKVTVAVITCKRPSWLERLLTVLQQQEIESNVHLDILVVDNDPQQSAEEVFKKRQTSSTYELHYYHEPQPGIVFARNRCVSEFLKTDSQHLIFIDDDEWPHQKDWVQRLLNKQVSRNCDVVTSHVMPVRGEGTPTWAVDLMYGENLLIEDQSLKVFYTNNVLITRKVLETINPAFDKRFAMTGASDYHFALKTIKAGFEVVYTDAPVEEELPASRAKVSWFLRRGFRSGIGFTRSHLFEDKLPKAIVYCLLMAGVRLVRGLVKLLMGTITLNKTRLVDGLFRVCSFAGTIAGFFGIKHDEYKTIHGQ